MNVTLFYDGMALLSDFFGKKLSQVQQDFYFKDLKYITKESFDHAIRSILKERKPNSGNFPTISEIQALCPRQKSDFNYNLQETEEDYYKRVNVQDLWEALKVLENHGSEQFIRHCKARNISSDDIERIEWKHKYSITSEKLAKKIKTAYNPERIKMLKEQADLLSKQEVPF